MIRRTLDYCCLFDFQPQTKDEGLNRDLRWLMQYYSEAERMDYVGRYEWDDMRRVAESLKIMTGDSFFVPLREWTVQQIEGSFCRNPTQFDNGGTWARGARLNRRGRVVQWNFREHLLTSFGEYEYKDRQVPARNVWQHVQYEGRCNQIRGYAQIAPALNELRDIYETFDHARAKVKLEQIFGIAIFEKEDEEDIPGGLTDENGDEVEESDQAEATHYDFGSGPVVMRRTVGEDVKLLQSQNPSSATQEFLKLCIHVALKALDLPMNFFDEAHTNFFGSRAAWNLYERSCQPRRQSQLRLHHRMTKWRFMQWTLPADLGGTGEIKLPRAMTLDDMTYRWVPRGLPWWKPGEELDTNLAAVAAGLKTMQGVCDENNLGIYEENLKALAREREQAERFGFVLQFNPAKLAATLQPSVRQAGGQPA